MVSPPPRLPEGDGGEQRGRRGQVLQVVERQR